jgi:hypothetical protein
MSDTTIIAILAAIPPTLMALAAFRQGKINTVMAEKAEVKADSIIHKADEIHTMTNSNLTKVNADLEMANKRVESLENLIKSMAEPKQPETKKP